MTGTNYFRVEKEAGTLHVYPPLVKIKEKRVVFDFEVSDLVLVDVEDTDTTKCSDYRKTIEQAGVADVLRLVSAVTRTVSFLNKTRGSLQKRNNAELSENLGTANLWLAKYRELLKKTGGELSFVKVSAPCIETPKIVTTHNAKEVLGRFENFSKILEERVQVHT